MVDRRRSQADDKEDKYAAGVARATGELVLRDRKNNRPGCVKESKQLETDRPPFPGGIPGSRRCRDCRPKRDGESAQPAGSFREGATGLCQMTRRWRWLRARKEQEQQAVFGKEQSSMVRDLTQLRRKERRSDRRLRHFPPPDAPRKQACAPAPTGVTHHRPPCFRLFFLRAGTLHPGTLRLVHPQASRLIILCKQQQAFLPQAEMLQSAPVSPEAVLIPRS
ncbi:hypothetical protein T310_7715 [Rasamsonia emersonii CBS 393.64]|uniref:Uncharacterized protein n=1 Tax=Rasamsonia emersonii (strain ATCC 16479 / CBS 393.64 / IMI 116815) TaxID=1408163 RepID=A0A0F4YKE3_RASE3|nr:hypothetical protein T310_7715 [Rasamsonia emersonii CBS 393.64]KKA18331.1 hypothetical protein T310_7715 [Rasamsonia emersonii CBS 393.64]